MNRQALWTQHEGDIWQIRVPVPFPLRWVNGYLLRGEDGWTVLDPGLHNEASLAAWETAMREIGVGFGDVRQIVLTHHHPDHLGLAGWFQEKSGAPVRLSPEGEAQMKELWGDGTPMTGRLLDLFSDHGMYGAQLANMREHLDAFVPLVSPLPEITPLAAGEEIAMGGRRWQTVHAPGHARGQLLFYDRESGDLVCGDQVLPVITPNVSVVPGFGDDPLGEFLDSLERLSELRVKRAFPGHRDPFGDVPERCRAIIRHHHERLARMTELLDEPLTALDLCLRLFGRNLTVHQLRFALGETLAHLFRLEAGGRVRRFERDGTIRWDLA